MIRSFLVIALCAGIAVAAPAALAKPQDPVGLRLLLVGNSYTRFNLLPVLVSRLGNSVADGPPVAVEMVARGGYTLRMHWKWREALRRIRHRGYTHVVLQGHSLRPIDRAGEMSEYVQRFVREIGASGARAVLYETWARRADASLYGKRPGLAGPLAMQDVIGGVYRRLADDFGAHVAPVGSAFLAASYVDPEIGLYKNDGAHPSFAGSYLAACVIYGAVSGRDPRGATYEPYELQPEHAKRLRNLAATVLAYAPDAPAPRAPKRWPPFPVRSDQPWAGVEPKGGAAPADADSRAGASMPADATPASAAERALASESLPPI